VFLLFTILQTKHNFQPSTAFNLSKYQRLKPQLTKICLAIEELLDVGSVLHRIYQLNQLRISLQPLSSILNEVLIVTQLEENQICIGDFVSDNIWSSLGKLRTLQVCFDRLQEPISVTLLMLWIVNLLVVREECRNEKCSPLEIDQHQSFMFLETILTINDHIADSIGPVFFILSFAIICTQLPAPMSEDRIALSKNLSTRHLNNWKIESQNSGSQEHHQWLCLPHFRCRSSLCEACLKRYDSKTLKI
jgi:hypothetical protein